MNKKPLKAVVAKRPGQGKSFQSNMLIQRHLTLDLDPYESIFVVANPKGGMSYSKKMTNNP